MYTTVQEFQLRRFSISLMESAKLRRRDLLVQRLHGVSSKGPEVPPNIKAPEKLSSTTLPCPRSLPCYLDRLALESELKHTTRQMRRLGEYYYYYQWCVWRPDAEVAFKVERLLQTPTEFKQLLHLMREECWPEVKIFKIGCLPLRKYHDGGSTLEFQFSAKNTALRAFKTVAERVMTNSIYELPGVICAITGVSFKQQPQYSIVRIWCSGRIELRSMAFWLTGALDEEWDDCVQVNNEGTELLRLVPEEGE